MSESLQQTWIDAPVEVVWELIADVDNHPAWWPRIVESECEELGEGCVYRQVVHTPFGNDDMNLRIDAFDDCEEFRIRCVNSGTFVRFVLTPAQSGTFVEGRMGMEPDGLASRVFDAVAGRIYFRRWLTESLKAMARTAHERARAREAA
jgi:hypothetical protein